MHAAVASQSVVNAMLAKYFEMEAAGKAEQSRLDTEYMQKAEADLRKGWGSSYDENSGCRSCGDESDRRSVSTGHGERRKLFSRKTYVYGLRRSAAADQSCA